MRHEERFIQSQVNYPSHRYEMSDSYCEEHIYIPEFKLARYADTCEIVVMISTCKTPNQPHALDCYLYNNGYM